MSDLFYMQFFNIDCYWTVVADESAIGIVAVICVLEKIS